MKTNLDFAFKTNSELETKGVRFVISDGQAFIVRRFGGANNLRVKAVLAKYYKPYARQIEAGTISSEKEKEILVKSFVEAAMVDWEGIEIDGQITPYSPEMAIKLFIEIPELFQMIYAYATELSSYKQDLGNY